MPDRIVMSGPRRALFGKLPAHGDFVRRGEPALVQRLDGWLTGEVERLAADPDRPYEALLQALPVWCFTLVDGFAGALAGSQDRVGRLFPVVAMAEGGEAIAMAAAALLVDAGAGALDADGVFGAEEWMVDTVEPPVRPAEAACWWRSTTDDRVTVTAGGLPTGPEFGQLLAGGG